MEIKVQKMSLEEAKKLGVDSWETWSSATWPSKKFDWTYEEKETMYYFKGLLKLTPKGGETVEVTGGMLVTIPAGTTCTWEIIEEAEKAYTFN